MLCTSLTVSYSELQNFRLVQINGLTTLIAACRSWLLGERIIHVGDADACKLLMTCEHDLVEGMHALHKKQLMSDGRHAIQYKRNDSLLKASCSW